MGNKYLDKKEKEGELMDKLDLEYKEVLEKLLKVNKEIAEGQLRDEKLVEKLKSLGEVNNERYKLEEDYISNVLKKKVENLYEELKLIENYNTNWLSFVELLKQCQSEGTITEDKGYILSMRVTQSISILEKHLKEMGKEDVV